MSYQKQNFANGEVLSASQLNHIENGIVDVESAANATKTVVDNIIDPTLSLSGKAADAKATGDAVGQLNEDLADYYGIYSNYEYETGSLKWPDGSEISDDTCARTKMLHLPKGFTILYLKGMSVNLHKYANGVQTSVIDLDYSASENKKYVITESGDYRLRIYYKPNFNQFRNNADGLARMVSILPIGYDNLSNIYPKNAFDKLMSQNFEITTEEGLLEIDGTPRIYNGTSRMANIEYLPNGTIIKNVTTTNKRLTVTVYKYSMDFKKIHRIQ